MIHPNTRLTLSALVREKAKERGLKGVKAIWQYIEETKVTAIEAEATKCIVALLDELYWQRNREHTSSAYRPYIVSLYIRICWHLLISCHPFRTWQSAKTYLALRSLEKQRIHQLLNVPHLFWSVQEITALGPLFGLTEAEIKNGVAATERKAMLAVTTLPELIKSRLHKKGLVAAEEIHIYLAVIAQELGIRTEYLRVQDKLDECNFHTDQIPIALRLTLQKLLTITDEEWEVTSINSHQAHLNSEQWQHGYLFTESSSKKKGKKQ